jgi:transcriptional regulator with XRE-family HTH domain
MYRSIGESVKIARERMGLSQSQIAEYLGVDLSYIDMCELDQRSFSVDMLEKLAYLFGCSYEDLESGLDIYPNKDLLELRDLDTITSINKIISNIKEMKYLLEKEELKYD